MIVENATAGEAAERRLVLVMGAVVFVDTMFYAVIAPLLPGLVHELHLSKLSAGVLTASYPIGTLLGALPGGMLAVRAGPRFAVCTGLGLLAVSTVAFGLLHQVVALDAARFLEGIGGACSWAGAVAWIVAETAPERRGTMIGRALGAAIGGALFGPVIGAIADAIGRRALFTGLALIAVGLIAVARRLPCHHRPSHQGMGHIGSALRAPLVVGGMWLVALPALASGMINVLGPLRLHRFGADAAAIGLTFLAAAAIEAAISPAIGTISDRRGRLAPLRFGLAAATGVLLCFTLPTEALALAAVIVAISAALGVFWAPAMALLSDAAETRGLDQGLAAALMNLAWAGGQIAGSVFGGAVAKVAGDAVPMSVAAALCATTLLALSGVTAPRRAGSRIR
jgi:MFS family permease